jgi:hypothetical protein
MSWYVGISCLTAAAGFYALLLFWQWDDGSPHGPPGALSASKDEQVYAGVAVFFSIYQVVHLKPIAGHGGIAPHVNLMI